MSDNTSQEQTPWDQIIERMRTRAMVAGLCSVEEPESFYWSLFPVGMARGWIERAEKSEAFIEARGYRRCDIPACNCGSFHGGHAEARLGEIRDVLEDSDLETNGKSTLALVKELQQALARAQQNWKQLRRCADRAIRIFRGDRSLMGASFPKAMDDLEARLQSSTPQGHVLTCPAYGNYQPPYEECDCGYEQESR